MIKELKARLQQGYRTIAFPAKEPSLPDRLRARPKLEPSKCQTNCRDCKEACPVEAIIKTDSKITIDLGKCIFCGACEQKCPNKAITFTDDYRLATTSREDLLFDGTEYKLAKQLDEKCRKLFGRSLRLRQVSAGGCNACEADINVLSTVVFDLGRFGIQFVASPRHADGIVVTGPVTENMKLALEKTYKAVPEPRLVIAVGACAISGGIYRDHPETHNGVTELLPVDLYIPGCPPHPITILDGFLRLLDRIPR